MCVDEIGAVKEKKEKVMAVNRDAKKVSGGGKMSKCQKRKKETEKKEGNVHE